MGTIIAHGKNQWGRSNKNKRIDHELEAELTFTESPKSVETHESVILKDISEQVNIGTKVIKKIDGLPANVPAAPTITEAAPAPFVRNRGRSSAITHDSAVVEKKYKTEDVNVDIVMPNLFSIMPDVSVQPKRNKKKINKANRVSNDGALDPSSGA